jgi:4a-hydroxytetrahydrobiopterin dehydratase
MTGNTKLGKQEVQHELDQLNSGAADNWEIIDGKLHKQFKFDDFEAAMQFMLAVAGEAEALDHHPEWCNVYNRVTVDLTTHSADGITALDFALASKMEALC